MHEIAASLTRPESYDDGSPICLVPEETINYVSQILLGVISGLLLSEVIVLYSSDPNDINLFNKSVLALIGGFSSDAIFSILQGLINRLKNIFVPAKSWYYYGPK